MSPQIHQSDPRILGRRTLERDHRVLAAMLRAGMSVLDVGCGTGAITAGIARVVGPEGSAMGVDRDEGLLEIARREHGAVANLRFEHADATRLPYREQFDVVTAARAVQWISEPECAIGSMIDAAKVSGRLVVLDYNHAENHWEPDPPPEFREFYRAFLAWRESNGWDNRMADRLPELFRSCGLQDLEVHHQDEIAKRGDLDFGEHADLWSQVIENLGSQVVTAGFLNEARLREAREAYEPWTRTELRRQTLVLRAIVGTVPA